MEKISAVISTYNEEDNIAECIESVKDADEIVVADDGSTDKTVEIAESMGARVFCRKDWRETIEEETYKKFKDRFGWEPTFNPGDKIRNGDLEATEAVQAAENDWVVKPDADERVSWNINIIHELLPVADQIVSEFVHSHDKFGNPDRVSTITKLFRQSETKIAGRTHTCIIPNGRILQTNAMRVDHWQRPGHNQSYVLPILEYCVAKDDDQRSRFYLGREYYSYRKYNEALKMLDLYLEKATWNQEIEKAYIYKASCYWQLQRGDEAREAALKAVLINPDDSEALMLMSEYYFEPWKSKWAYIASHATNKDVLF